MAAKTKTTFDKNTLLVAVSNSPLLKPERVTIESLGGDLFAKRLSVGERDNYFDEMALVTEGSGNAEAFARAVVDEAGALMFDPYNVEDLAIIRQLPTEVMNEVLQKFYKVNRFTTQADQVKKEGEADLKKY